MTVVAWGPKQGNMTKFFLKIVFILVFKKLSYDKEEY